MTRHILLTALLLGLLLLSACGDDATDPGLPPDPVDETAPLVVSLDPGHLQNAVPVSGILRVRFSEPVDTTTLADALNLTHGEVDGFTWNDDEDEVLISHTPWPDGEEVTFTVGSGVTDLAGNTLPQAFSTTFFTSSPDPVMVAHDFFAPATAVPVNGYIVLQFSHPMELNSIFNASTLNMDPPPGTEKAAAAIRVGTVDGDYSRVKIIWDGDLAPATRYEYVLSTDARTRDGAYLSVGFSLQFVTAAGVDETPPYVLSTSPALDSVVAPNVGTITVTFSEPIDPSYREPGIRSALLDMFMAREPVWNAAGDEMTVYLAADLPAGVRFYAIWEDANLYDMCGNWNPEPDSLSFQTAGEAALVPVREDLRWYYTYSWGDKAPQFVRQTLENLGGGRFDRVLMLYTGTGFDDQLERYHMGLDDGTVTFRGFVDDGQDIMFNPPIAYIPHPLTATWSGETTVTMDGVPVTLSYAGERSEPYRDYYHPRKISGGTYLDDCVDVEIHYTMTLPGETEPFQTGTDYLGLCPGLGFRYAESEGYEYDGGVEVGEWYDSLGLMGLGFDDRFNLGDWD